MMRAVGPGVGPPLALATVSAAVPLFPSLVAVIVAAPSATPVTRPLDDTVATAVLFDVHVTVRPVRMFPFASLTTALSCCAAPTDTLADAGLTATVATAAVEGAVVARAM